MNCYFHALKWALLKRRIIVDLYVDGAVLRISEKCVCHQWCRWYNLWLSYSRGWWIFGSFDPCWSMEVRTLQAFFCCSSVTFSCVRRAFSDKCPVRLCITCSGRLAWNMSEAPVAHKLWLLRRSIPAWSHILLSILFIVLTPICIDVNHGAHGSSGFFFARDEDRSCPPKPLKVP